MRVELARNGIILLAATVLAVNCTGGGGDDDDSGTTSSSSSSSSGGTSSGGSSHSGTTSSGGATSGTTSSGGSSHSGTTSSGGATSGTTSSGGATSGTTSSGGSSHSGTTSSGGATSGTTSSGGASSGASSSGGTSSGGCTISDFTVEQSQASYFKDGQSNQDAWRFEAIQADPLSQLMIENWVAYGAPATPGTHNVTATEASYFDCGFCVLAFSECDAQTGACAKTFMPKAGGSYTLTTMDKTEGGTFAGTLTGVTMQEVTIDDQLTTTPVVGGATWCLPSFSFTATVTLPAADGGV